MTLKPDPARISDKAVEAALEAVDPDGRGYVDRRDIQVILQAALPVLLEGKAEEIARAFYDGCGYYRHGGPWPKKAKPEDSGAIRDSFLFANRIISILTGESDER